MARVKFSSIISDISGSVGTATFQKGHGGNIIRNKPYPTKIDSSYQYYSKLFMLQAQAAWYGLSSDEQSLWNSFLSYVPAYQRKNGLLLLNGYNLFVKYNMLHQHSGLGLFTTFTFTPLNMIDITPTVTNSGGLLYVDVVDDVNITNNFIVLKISAPLKVNSLAYKRKVRLMHIGGFGPTYYNHWNITSEYYTRFGLTPAVGDKLLVAITLCSSVSPIIVKEQYFQVTVT